ncbi:MAG: pyridoxamine 5'-phosphate oxidase family protein [Rubritepida sp.]|nr:pyridoxamine 5'-phosphate oxidase family protein [Rubritepida sp.]
MTRPFYHDDMRALQDASDGRRVADALERHRLHRTLTDEDVAMIRAAPCLFIATGDGTTMDCSVKAGDPGFVQVTGPAEIEWPDYDGNSMYRTLGNILRNPHVGLLFVAFDGRSRRLRISGRATLHEDAATLARHHGGRRVVRVACDEIYPNCPRYIPDLATGAPSPFVPRPGEAPPAPEWKSRDYIRDILPRDDPHRG